MGATEARNFYLAVNKNTVATQKKTVASIKMPVTKSTNELKESARKEQERKELERKELERKELEKKQIATTVVPVRASVVETPQ